MSGPRLAASLCLCLLAVAGAGSGRAQEPALVPQVEDAPAEAAAPRETPEAVEDVQAEGSDPDETGTVETERIIDAVPAQPDSRIRTQLPLGAGDGEGEGASGLPERPSVPEAPEIAEPEPQRIFRLGIVPQALGRRARSAALLDLLEPLRSRLADALGRPAEIVPLTSYEALVDAQILGRIDGGFFSGAAYAAAEMQCQCLDPLVAPVAPDGTTRYYAIVVARRDSGIGMLADLEGRRVAVGPEDSIASRLAPFAALASEGRSPETFLGGIEETASPVDAIRKVANGEVDAAFAWSSMEGDPAEGYSRGSLADLARGGEIDVGDLAVIWRSPPIGHSPVAISESLRQADKDAIRDVLLSLTGDVDLYDLLDPIYGGGFAPVRAADYGGFDAILGGEGR